MHDLAFTSYALLGSGRLARHLQFYLQQLELPVKFWSRDGHPQFNSLTDADPKTRLERTLTDASHVLLAISDRALAPFADALAGPRRVVHFSGATLVPGAISAHPLMTFGERLESAAWYRAIPFVIESPARWEDILPGWPNPHYSLPSARRPLYHALCALAGNSAFLLWRRIGDEFESSLGLPRAVLNPFLHQVVHNAGFGGRADFTGPVARQDWETVHAHLQALHPQPDLARAYYGFLQLAEAAGLPVPTKEWDL